VRHTRKRLGTSVAIGVGSFVLFGVVTGLIPTPLYTRTVPRTGFDYVFLGLTAGFLGRYALQRTPGGADDDRTATAGAVLGFLAFGCPTCNAWNRLDERADPRANTVRRILRRALDVPAVRGAD
jgi:hypothetical protein